jgi:tetratricopeptide (TPR) repeat protein
MKKHAWAVVALALCVPCVVSAQSSDTAAVDLNDYYKFPVAIGFEYQGLTPFSPLVVPYSIFDFSGSVTVPIRGLPVIQPFARLGYARFNSLDTQFPGKWDLFQLYGELGISYATRIARNFELGVDLSAGVSEAVFPYVIDTGAVGSPFLLLGAGGRVSLTPSYGFSIDFHPSLRYQAALGPLTGLNGFLLSLGVSAGFRFGEDPDSARAIIRSLRFEKAEIVPAFASMQSLYSRAPIGKVTVVNTERQALSDLEVSFIQKGYMDAPTRSWSAASLPPGASVEVPLRAVFNGKVFDLEGGATPLTGEVIATYKLGGRAAEQRFPVSYELWDKTAMTWDDDRKAAAFITPLDIALKNYTAFISEAGRDAALSTWNQPLQAAIVIYDALREINIYYQEDPSSPYTKVHSNPQIVDFISMPRITLTRRYGDCKNLTVLYASLLETKNIRTGFITVPGHIYPAFDTGVAAADYRDLNPDQTMTLAVGGTLWIPVEVTMLDGKSDFLAAWTRAIEEWKQYDKDRMLYRTGEAQATYSPVAVQQTDLGLQYGKADEIVGYFRRDLETITAEVLRGYSGGAEQSRDKKVLNRLGMSAAKIGRYKEAEDAFTRALKIDPKYTPAGINLGNVAFLRKDYGKAREAYRNVIPLLGSPRKGSKEADMLVILLVNMSRALAAVGNPSQSQASLAQAAALDPARVRSLGAVPMGASGGTRASDSSAAEGAVTFAEEQD